MAKRVNYGFDKRKKEKQRQEKAQKKREKKLASKEPEGDEVQDATPSPDAESPE